MMSATRRASAAIFGFIVPPRRAGQIPWPVTIESRGKASGTASEESPICLLRWTLDESGAGLAERPGLARSACQDRGQAGGGEFLPPFPVHPRLALLPHRPGPGRVAEQLGDARHHAATVTDNVAGLAVE